MNDIKTKLMEMPDPKHKLMEDLLSQELKIQVEISSKFYLVKPTLVEKFITFLMAEGKSRDILCTNRSFADLKGNSLGYIHYLKTHEGCTEFFDYEVSDLAIQHGLISSEFYRGKINLIGSNNSNFNKTHSSQ